VSLFLGCLEVLGDGLPGSGFERGRSAVLVANGIGESDVTLGGLVRVSSFGPCHSSPSPNFVWVSRTNVNGLRYSDRGSIRNLDLPVRG